MSVETSMIMILWSPTVKNSRGEKVTLGLLKNKSVKKKINCVQVQIPGYKAAVQNTYFYV